MGSKIINNYIALTPSLSHYFPAGTSNVILVSIHGPDFFPCLERINTSILIEQLHPAIISRHSGVFIIIIIPIVWLYATQP
jgi:hypothetical protein